MLLGHSRSVGWFRTALVFIALMTGLVGSTVDLIQNHLSFSTRRTSALLEDPGGPCRPHFECGAGLDCPPCNACFFNKLLGQTVVPARRLWTDRGDSVPVRLRPAGLHLSVEPTSPVNRGPPASWLE